MTSVLVQLQVIAEQRKMLMSNIIPNKTPKTRDENKILKFLLSSPRITRHAGEHMWKKFDWAGIFFGLFHKYLPFDQNPVAYTDH